MIIFVFMKLRDWIDINKINWDFLSLNKNAIELLKANPDKIDWEELFINFLIFFFKLYLL